MQLENGVNPGELVSSVDGVHYVKTYTHEYRMDVAEGETEWTGINISSRKCVITGLRTWQRSWVRIAAVGTNNQVVYNDAVSRMVQ